MLVLRTPNPSNGNNERIVNTSGALDNNNSNNTNGVAADCIFHTVRTSSVPHGEGESSTFMQGRFALMAESHEITA